MSANQFSEYTEKLFLEMTEKGYIFAQPSWPRNAGTQITFKELSVSFPVLPERSDDE